MNYKKIISLFISLCLMASFCLLPAGAEETVETDLSVANGCHSIDAATPLLGRDRVVQNARSVFMFETGSQTLLYEWEPDLKMYPASLVKIMTALLVLENGNLQDTVTVTESALKSIDVYSRSVKLQVGETMSVENLMYCLLVYSANDAASVLAEYISGSEEAFVALMNSRAQELGCTATNYTNPHGLHNKNQYTTARDTCRVVQAALEHDTFRSIFGTVSYAVPATNLNSKQRNLTTNNHLMNSSLHYYDERVTGGRGGETAEGEKNLASLSQSGNMEIICVVMGSKPSYSNDGRIKDEGCFYETTALLDKAYDGYVKRQIIVANKILRQQNVTGGDSSLFVAARKSFSTVLPSTITLEQLSFQYADAAGSDQAPISKGQAVGALQVWYGSMCIAQTDVYAMNDVPKAYQKTAQLKEIETKVSLWGILGIILAAAVVAAVTIIIFVKLRSKSPKKTDTESQYRRRRPKWDNGKN